MGLTSIAQEFAEAVDRASHLEELAGLIEVVAREMGFDYFALSHHVDIPRAPQPAIRIHNYPAEWIDYFDAHQLGPSDPVHRASQQTNVLFPWARVGEMIPLTSRDVAILERARRAGLHDGVTVPAHVPGESAGSCSFAIATARPPLHYDRIAFIQLAGAIAFDGARRLSGIRSLVGVRPRLTDRQRDCIHWAARGKSDWEIAQILGISHETAIQHGKQARDRYGVVKRAQLTVHALFDGTVSFVDLLRR